MSDQNYISSNLMIRANAVANMIMSKIVLTETDWRDSAWSEAFAKVLSKETGKKWTSEGWNEGPNGWDMKFSNMEYTLTLNFGDSKVGYLLTSYRLAVHGDKGVSVTRVFANNKELLASIQDKLATMTKEAARLTPSKYDYLIACGMLFEDGQVEAPSGYQMWFPEKHDKKNMEPQFVVMFKTITLTSNDLARDELKELNRQISSRWKEGYYPPRLAAYNLTTRKVIPLNINERQTAGFLGEDANGTRWNLNDRLAEKMGIRIPTRASTGLGEMMAGEDDQLPSSAFDVGSGQVITLPPDQTLGASADDGSVDPFDDDEEIEGGINQCMGPTHTPWMRASEFRPIRAIIAGFCAEWNISQEGAIRAAQDPLVTALGNSLYNRLAKYLDDLGFEPADFHGNQFVRNAKNPTSREEITLDSGIIIYRKGNGKTQRLTEDQLQNMVG